MKLNYQLPNQVVARLFDDLDFGNMYFGAEKPPNRVRDGSYEHRDSLVRTKNISVVNSTVNKSDAVINTLKLIDSHKKKTVQNTARDNKTNDHVPLIRLKTTTP